MVVVKLPNTTMGEIAKAGFDIKYMLGVSQRENPDRLIANKGMEYIEELERDPHIASVLDTRAKLLLAKGWKILPAENSDREITPEAQEVADFASDQLQEMKGSFEQDIVGMLDGVSKGFSLTEINYRYLHYGRWTGKYGLKSLRLKPARYFSFKFDDFGHYTLVQVDPDHMPLPSNKFIHMIFGRNDENPYGESVTSRAAFWIWLKKNQAKFWAVFNEKFGDPNVKITIPNDFDKEKDQEKLDELVSSLQNESGIQIPEGFLVELLEAQRSGDATYDTFIERCNKEISKAVLGVTLTNEAAKGGGGSYALGSNHMDVLKQYIEFDAKITETAINEQLITRLVAMNFLDAPLPRFKWNSAFVGHLPALSQALEGLARTGMEISVSYAHEITGIPQPRPGEKVLVPMEIPAGSQPSLKGTDNKAFNERDDVDTLEQMAHQRGVLHGKELENLFVKKKS